MIADDTYFATYLLPMWIFLLKYISDWGKLFFICPETSVKSRTMNYEILSNSNYTWLTLISEFKMFLTEHGCKQAFNLYKIFPK